MEQRLERINKAIAYLKGQEIIKFQKDIVLAMGTDKGNLSKALNGDGRYLTDSFILRFCKVFHAINHIWLLTGDGEMLASSVGNVTNNVSGDGNNTVSTANTIVGKGNRISNGVSEPALQKPGFHSNAAIKDFGSKIMAVPLISQYAYAGYITGYADVEFIENQPFLTVNENYTPGNYIAFEVSGDSMYDDTARSICDGDIIVGRELYRDHWKSKFRKNEVYIIVHRERGICIKEISHTNMDTGAITCHSWNEDYEDYELNLNDVIQIFYKKELRRK